MYTYIYIYIYVYTHTYVTIVSSDHTRYYPGTQYIKHDDKDKH